MLNSIHKNISVNLKLQLVLSEGGVSASTTVSSIKNGNLQGTVFILGLNTVMQWRSVYGF
jgi:hypothetical protein